MLQPLLEVNRCGSGRPATVVLGRLTATNQSATEEIMSRQYLVTFATAFAAVMFVVGAAMAHPGHEQKVLGTVTMLGKATVAK